MTDTIYLEDDDAAMKNALMTIQSFCRKHRCSRYCSKYCAWCLDNHQNVEREWDRQINRTAISEMLKDTELPPEDAESVVREGGDA